MKDTHHTEQEHLHPRTFALRNLGPQLPEQSLDVPPAHIGRDRPGMDQFKGALVFAFHDVMVSKNDIRRKQANERPDTGDLQMKDLTPETSAMMPLPWKKSANYAFAIYSLQTTPGPLDTG